MVKEGYLQVNLSNVVDTGWISRVGNVLRRNLELDLSLARFDAIITVVINLAHGVDVSQFMGGSTKFEHTWKHHNCSLD